jgi:hypothetical protein
MRLASKLCLAMFQVSISGHVERYDLEVSVLLAPKGCRLGRLKSPPQVNRRHLLPLMPQLRADSEPGLPIKCLLPGCQFP